MNKHAIQDQVYRGLTPIKGLVELRIKSGGCGLFGDFFMALSGLRYCARHGLLGRPWWDQRSLYFSSSHGPNAWDYFFEPVGEVRRPIRLPYFGSARLFQSEAGKPARQVASEAVARFGRVRPTIIEQAQNFFDRELQAGNYIGVHVRGTDVRAEGRESGSRAMYERAIEASLQTHPDSVIFLATDEETTVDFFREKWGNRLRIRDCIRSSDGRSIHGHYDGGQEGSPHQKGIDVVVDALLLSWGKHLVRMHSQVTAYSIALSPKLTFTDVDVLAGVPPRMPWLFT